MVIYVYCMFSSFKRFMCCIPPPLSDFKDCVVLLTHPRIKATLFFPLSLLFLPFTMLQQRSLWGLVFLGILITLGASVPLPGAPGTRAVQDQFNANGIWNRTYGPSEPQQLHMAWMPDGKNCRIQFATFAPLDNALLQYWLEGDRDFSTMMVSRVEVQKKNATMIRLHVCILILTECSIYY